MIYKVSYVVPGHAHPGAIINQTTMPYVGEKVRLGDLWCEIVETKDLLPPHGDFAYIHVTCRPIPTPETETTSS
ncbi:MAG: hypothetical protein GYA30_06185 [Chloroflexi bacterium]|nr:hypothetical protein [Chloroflexota bacterium]HQJ12206.1 hypothetical protein [Anaerolineae bacterium]